MFVDTSATQSATTDAGQTPAHKSYDITKTDDIAALLEMATMRTQGLTLVVDKFHGVQHGRPVTLNNKTFSHVDMHNGLFQFHVPEMRASFRTTGLSATRDMMTFLGQLSQGVTGAQLPIGCTFNRLI
jgi:hypothetical protein